MKLEWFGDVLNVSAIKTALTEGVNPNAFEEVKRVPILVEEKELDSHRKAFKQSQDWPVCPLTKTIRSEDISKIDVVRLLFESKADPNLMFLDNMPLFKQVEKNQNGLHREGQLNLKLLPDLFKVWPEENIGYFFLQKIWLREDMGGYLYWFTVNLALPLKVSGLICDYNEFSLGYKHCLEYDSFQPAYSASLGHFLMTKMKELFKDKISNLLNLYMATTLTQLVIEYVFHPTPSSLDEISNRLSLQLPTAQGLKPFMNRNLSPLNKAAYCANMAQIKSLIETKADVTAQEEGSELTPLDYAVMGPGSHQPSTVKFIVSLLCDSYHSMYSRKTIKPLKPALEQEPESITLS